MNQCELGPSPDPDTDAWDDAVAIAVDGGFPLPGPRTAWIMTSAATRITVPVAPATLIAAMSLTKLRMTGSRESGEVAAVKRPNL